MRAYIDQTKLQFDELNSREKILVCGGAIALAILLFIFLAYLPTYEKAKSLQEDIQFNQEDVQWMQDASIQLQGSGNSNHVSGSNRSLLALLDEQFKAAGISSTVQSIQPDGKDKAKVRLENCAFDTLITLLGKMEQYNNIIVLRTSLKQAATSGRVDGNITFSRG